MTAEFSTLVNGFSDAYDAAAMDAIWRQQSEIFHAFWNDRVMSDDGADIPDVDCDPVIAILDRNAKGNTKGSEAVARAMVPQGAWRRLFNEFHTNKPLRSLFTQLLTETDPGRKAQLIDELYRVNKDQKNNLTGPSGNAVCAFLAGHDPFNNVSVISLKDRRTIIEYFGFSVPFDWATASIGTRIVVTNGVLLEGLRALGLEGSARTLSRFCYYPPVRALWKGEHTVKRSDKPVSVTVPLPTEGEEAEESDKDELRESMQIQALLAHIGTSMGFSIWLPKADRGRVLKAWTPEPGQLLDELPLGYDATTMKTVEQIDVLWLRKRSIVRAFEVEHTTSVYSGLLRMADLVALQPNINIKLHIVAPLAKRDKVLQEIRRPVFSLLEGRALSEMCTYLSYDAIREIGESKHLAHLSDNVLDDYEDDADSEE